MSTTQFTVACDMSTSHNTATANDDTIAETTNIDNTTGAEHLPGAILESRASPECPDLIPTEPMVEPEICLLSGLEALNISSPPPQGKLDNQHPYWTDLYITCGSSSGHNNNSECYICLEAIAPTDETLTHETCGLSFCRFCIETWLQEGNNTCPKDRERIFAPEVPHPTYENLYITYGASPRNCDKECPICQEDIAPIDETLTHEICKLSFCRACFETWLECGNDTCPTCRGPIPDNGYYSDEESDSENDTSTETETGSEYESDWDSDVSGSSSSWESGWDSDDDDTIYISLERYAQITATRSLW